MSNYVALDQRGSFQKSEDGTGCYVDSRQSVTANITDDVDNSVQRLSHPRWQTYHLLGYAPSQAFVPVEWIALLNFL